MSFGESVRASFVEDSSVFARLFYAWDAISFTTMAAGPVSHGNALVLDPWRRVGGAQKVPASTSFHVTMPINGLLFSLFRWVDGCQYLPPAIGTCTRCCATTAESLEERSSEKEGRRSGFSFEAERRSGLATADFSVRKSSL